MEVNKVTDNKQRKVIEIVTPGSPTLIVYQYADVNTGKWEPATISIDVPKPMTALQALAFMASMQKAVDLAHSLNGVNHDPNLDPTNLAPSERAVTAGTEPAGDRPDSAAA